MPNDVTQLANPLMPGASGGQTVQPATPAYGGGLGAYEQFQNYMAQFQPQMPTTMYMPAPNMQQPAPPTLPQFPQSYNSMIASLGAYPQQLMPQPGMTSYQNAVNQMQQALGSMGPTMPQYPTMTAAPTTTYIPMPINNVQPMIPQGMVPSIAPASMPSTQGGGYIVEALNLPNMSGGSSNLA
jgi:hypothetical protein